MRKTTLTLIATLTAFNLAGCNGEAGMGMGPSGTPAGPDNPAPPATNNPDSPNGNQNTPPPPVANYAGVYDLTAPLDFTQNGVLPGLLSPALGSLAELHDHPGDALINILQNSNIPVVSSTLNKIPSFLLSAFGSLLDNLIINNLYKGYPVVDQITNIIEGIAELAKKMDVHDTVTVHTPASNKMAVEEQISGVDFTLLGNTTNVTLTTGKKVSTTGTILPHANAPVADADLQLGTASLSLPIGDLLLQAAGPLLFSQFGGATDLKGALLNLVPCASVGQDISDGLGGVISASEATMLCQTGIGLVADMVTAKIKAITFDGVNVTAGAGVLYDASKAKPGVDYQSDRIADGKWTWSFTIGSSVTNVPSTFDGDRIGTAN
jgi:hypothetical protein